MPKIFIDGKEYDAKQGQTIIQVADGMNCHHEKQVDIPRFCYHPSLSVAGNCRMCLVEFGMPQINRDTKQPVLDEKGDAVIGWVPKLTTACSTDIMDGMRVKTNLTSTMVRDAQKGVLEFILINHPLDCPTCDQAGECPLQQTTYKYGPSSSRFEFEKVHKPKRQHWGEKISFDAERCINCTRCVRFFQEYTKTNDLQIVQRGWNNYPYPPSTEAIDKNNYAMNVIDLCPVGALTSTDHRFHARVWEMSGTDTISVNDARGSNITLWVRNNVVMRATPRFNPQVNGYFMTDEDRLNYKWINEGRANAPHVKNGTTKKEVEWNEAIEAAATLIKKYSPNEIFILASTKSSLESLYMLKKFSQGGLRTTNMDVLPHINGIDDHLLARADKTPNSLGYQLLDIQSGLSVRDLEKRILEGSLKCVLAVEEEILNAISLDTLKKLETFITLPYHASDSTRYADVVLPAATFAEIVGTYVNFEGVVQLSKPAKMLKHQNRELTREMVLSRLDRHATQFDRWNNLDNKIDARPTWETLVELSSYFGLTHTYQTASEIFNALSLDVSAFATMNYKQIGKQGIKLQPIPAEL